MGRGSLECSRRTRRAAGLCLEPSSLARGTLRRAALDVPAQFANCDCCRCRSRATWRGGLLMRGDPNGDSRRLASTCRTPSSHKGRPATPWGQTTSGHQREISASPSSPAARMKERCRALTNQTPDDSRAFHHSCHRASPVVCCSSRAASEL